jgi:hypothetical protein
MNNLQLEIEEDQPPKYGFELQSHDLVEERLIWQHLARRKIHKMQREQESDSRRSKHSPSKSE